MNDDIGDLIKNFIEWVKFAKTSELEEFAIDIADTLLELEQEDYFGTEGLNKRFG